MLVILLKISEDASHIVMFLTANSKALNPVIVIILDDLICLALVAKIVLVEDYQLLLLVLLYDEIELRVSAAVWNTCVSDLHEDVDFVCVFFDKTKGLLHVAGEPVDVIFEVLDYVHSNDPTKFNYNNSTFSIRVVALIEMGCFEGSIEDSEYNKSI